MLLSKIKCRRIVKKEFFFISGVYFKILFFYFRSNGNIDSFDNSLINIGFIAYLTIIMIVF